MWGAYLVSVKRRYKNSENLSECKHGETKQYLTNSHYLSSCFTNNLARALSALRISFCASSRVSQVFAFPLSCNSFFSCFFICLISTPSAVFEYVDNRGARNIKELSQQSVRPHTRGVNLADISDNFFV